MGQNWKLELGASFLADGQVRFRVWAPFAKTVEVALLKKGKESYLKMDTEERGFHAVAINVDEGTDYLYILDGVKRRPDPVSRFQPQGVHKPSRVVNPASFEWSDNTWKGVFLEDLVIYELHVGAFTEEGTFESIIPHIDYLKNDLGITAIELMPVAQFPGERNWGYDGVHPYAPQNTYGGPNGLKRLVNACHSKGLAVILDVVYNHLGPEGNYLGDFGPYFSGRHRTPWGPAINYDDRGCDQVRRYVIDNALYWVTEYHIDGLRLDAIHGVFDFSPKHILQEVGEAVHSQAEALERSVLVIAESDLNDPKVITPIEECGYGLDAQWSDDFHHSVHAYLTGERSGYYQDFGRIQDIEKALRNGFVYDGKHSSFRGKRHGAPSFHLPAKRFVVDLQTQTKSATERTGVGLRAS